MRLLRWTSGDSITLTRDLHDTERPPYAILSHTWAVNNDDEVTFMEVDTEKGQKKPGYEKIRFCAEQARKDDISHFWIDTCCIDKTNHVELSEAIVSMYRWYQEAVKCYVYLTDVSIPNSHQLNDGLPGSWESNFAASRWFTRGWTLQELLAPRIVDFYSNEKTFIGDKKGLAQQICKITSIPVTTLCNGSLHDIPVIERMQWLEKRQTKKPEDRAYCMLGIFDISIPVIYGEGEKKAFHRLQREIQEQSGKTVRSANVHWMVSRSPNPIFTGRHSLLQELEDQVRDAVFSPWNRTPCQIVIFGLGGQGKSELCLQLSRRLRSIFWAVLWIDVSTIENAERSFLMAAQRLSLPGTNLEDVLYGISNLQHSWLLVLDNADDPEVDYGRYFPESPYGVILMTTRNDEFQQYSTDRSVALEALNVNEAQELLLKAARIPVAQRDEYSTDALQVVELLQSHSLALIQAGAYVARGHCTMAEYPRVYEKQRQRLLSFRPVQARSREGNVYATFETSMDMIRVMDTTASRDALQILPLLVVCAPNQYPLWLFKAAHEYARSASTLNELDSDDPDLYMLTTWHTTHLPEICDLNGPYDAYRLLEAVNLLRAFSLITTHLQEGFSYVSFHPLVHAWARDRQDEAQQLQAWLKTSCLIAFVLDDIGSRDMEKSQGIKLQTHIEALIDWPLEKILAKTPKKAFTRILVQCARYFLRHDEEARAEARLSSLMKDLFELLELDEAHVEWQWLALYELAGHSFMKSERKKEAVLLLEATVELREQRQPEGQEATNIARRGLVDAYIGNGQYKEAIELIRKVVELEEQVCPEDDLGLQACRFMLATAYAADLQDEKAAEIFEGVAAVHRLKLAKDDSSRLASQQRLARAYGYIGRAAEAIAILEETIDVLKQTLSENAPGILEAQIGLAGAFDGNEQYAEAVSLMTAVIETRRQMVPDDDRWLLQMQYVLAIYLRNSGEGESSISLMKQIISIRQRALEKNGIDSDGDHLLKSWRSWLTFWELPTMRNVADQP